MSERKVDHLYANEQDDIAPFQFDARVADVFADMVKRSVPGYLSLLEDQARLVEAHFSRMDFNEPAVVVDLGCSLGAFLQILAARLAPFPLHLIGVDNAEPMLAQAAELWVEQEHSTACWVEADLLAYAPMPADVIAMNFTLQFLPLAERDSLLKKLYDTLKPGGLLLLSEKIAFSNIEDQVLLRDAYHQFKADQGYSELEISQKRQALDNVLVPETREAHEARFASAGFTDSTLWSQRLPFASWLLRKPMIG